MAEGQALLRAVIDSPDDDAPRLEYAGWLESRGEPERGEFIRVQCALDTMSADDPRRPPLQAREAELLEQHGWTWAEEFGTEITEWVFRRGFIERVEMSLERPADQILAVLSKGPIRHIRDAGQFDDFDGLVEALPQLDHLTGLEFWKLYVCNDRLVAKLLNSPHLRNLRTLILHHDRNGNLVEDEVLIEGLMSPYRMNLRELAVNVDVMWRGPSPKVLMAMARSPYLANLRKLDLSETELTVELIRALGQSPAFAHLEELDLGGCSFPPRLWDEVLQGPWLPRLKWLRLSGAATTDAEGFHVDDLKNLPTYRSGFEDRVAVVDWDTVFIAPNYRNTSWQGLTWKERRSRPLRVMNPWVRAKDYAGLENEYRRLCQALAGAEIRAEIDCLPFDVYEEKLHKRVQKVLGVLPKKRGKAISLRISPDFEWRGEFHVQANDLAVTEDEVPEEISYEGPIVQIKGPDFPEASQIYQRHPLQAGTRPSGPALYLLARTVAAYGRCLAGHDLPVPVYFGCRHAVFCMSRP
ncbi:TIGR02996 domain-containing protein [Singulisphaera acidiphila]|uniref:Repeat-companion domain TIGR02996 n=1 Tax=Singulisphaera acidiphila (strain ATCC BAA-1392 / DSM 18658 / VKM B-2454 / MOB10) TaxID=886293 RepID=L0DGZ0_SINAD|nr:TIGR02996 domain-containing protein [Singulisphaera acidiphila]AGA28644.1 repeat-companion domain TIGR02996 [Singulisphaera acidiphila DSM 18658]